MLALAFASCHKPTADNSSSEPEPPAVAPSPATPPLAQPQVAAATPAPIVTTPAPELAPPGIFYLVQNVRIETDSGITGLPPGTGVKLVREGVYLTPAGEVPLQPEQITNKLAIARKARDADRAAQAALQNRAAQVSAASVPQASQNPAQIERAAKQVERDEVAARVAALVQQDQALRAQLAPLLAKKNKEDIDRSLKGRMVTSTTGADIAAIQAALNNIQAQINSLQTPR